MSRSVATPRLDPRLGALPAAVPAYAALVLARQAPEMLRMAGFYERNGRPEIGADLRVAADQLLRSAAQVGDGGILPRIGSAEAVGSEMPGESVSVSPPGRSLTVAQTAAMLDRTTRRVIQLIECEKLVAVHRGQGTSWEVDRQSVLDYLETRRSR